MELLIVIAIIGILTSIVMVSTQGAIDKSKYTSALTSASSVLPEIATCADDGGDIGAPTDATNGGGYVCVVPPKTANPQPGHTVTWPSLKNSGGWTYATPLSNFQTGDSSIFIMSFNLSNSNSNYGTPRGTITCNYASSTCQ